MNHQSFNPWPTGQAVVSSAWPVGHGLNGNIRFENPKTKEPFYLPSQGMSPVWQLQLP